MPQRPLPHLHLYFSLTPFLSALYSYLQPPPFPLYVYLWPTFSTSPRPPRFTIGQRGECRHEHPWCWWLISDRGVGSCRVVVASPALDDDLGLAQGVEDLAVEQLIAKAGVEALDVAVLPRAAPLDVSGFGTDSRDPLLRGLGHELRSVVGPDVSGNAPQDEEAGQNVDHIDRLELAGDTDRQAFMGELVEHVEHPILASIVGAVLDKVVGPDMIALLRPQPDARSVGQPEPAALGLLMRDLQPLALPDTLDPLVVECPARLAQQFGDLAIAIAAVLPSKLNNIGGETLPVLTTARDLALRRAMLPERRTGATLGDMQLRSHLLNAGTATRGA